jgi:vacuolar-type H+-ATPase subunit H
MGEEKSILQQVREKELMLNIKIYAAREEAEKTIQSARKEATEMIENSEIVAKKTASEYYDRELERVRKEIEQLRNQGNQEAITVRAEGERNLELAIEKIVGTVSMV